MSTTKPVSSQLTNNVEFLCQTIHSVVGVSIFLLDSELQTISCYSKWENQLKNFFLMDCPYDLHAIMHSCDHSLLRFSGSLCLNWMLFPVIEQHNFLVMGPVFDTDITPAVFQKKIEFNRMSVSSQIHFLKMMDDIPIIPLVQFIPYISMLYYGIYGIVPKIADISTKYEMTPPVSAPAFLDKTSYNIPDSHGSRQIEKILVESVRTGNIHLSNQITNTSQLVPGTLSSDPLRQAKNCVIALIALLVRAAVDGGMDVETAYSLSDYYIQNVELCQRSDEAYALSDQMYYLLVKQVHKIQTLKYNPLVVYMCSYINQHISEVISLKDLAASLGYDTYYLTTLFKKDTGKVIKTYILEKKIERAQLLLSTTPMEIQEISDNLSFKSSSYFCTQFKKITGESPLSYRKRVTFPNDE